MSIASIGKGKGKENEEVILRSRVHVQEEEDYVVGAVDRAELALGHRVLRMPRVVIRDEMRRLYRVQVRRDHRRVLEGQYAQPGLGRPVHGRGGRVVAARNSRR